MKFDNEVFKQLEMDRTYTYRDLTARLQCISPSAAESTCHAVISRLVRDGKIIKQGYDAYSLPNKSQKSEYIPMYSAESEELSRLVDESYNELSFVIFETRLMNVFLNHLIANNTIFLHVEKECSIYVFRDLQERGFKNIFYKPSLRELDLYREKNCIIVTDLISEAPLCAENPHEVTLEKMLVDMITDKLISSMFSKGELPYVMEDAQNVYMLNKAKMLRYAARRNKRQLVKDYLDGNIDA